MIAFAFLFHAWLAAAQTFDVYPPPRKPGPLVIFVHGGAWLGGSKAQYRALGEAFARRGLCAAIVDYHLAPEFNHPRPVEDLETARAKLIKNAGPRCDATRTVLIGHSAGAHAIAFWATGRGRARVRGFVGLEGIYDLVALAKRYPAYGDWFITPEFGPPSNWAKASPTTLKIQVKAPWLLVHSAADELVDVPQSSALAAHLGRDQIPTERFDLTTETHFGVIEALNAPTSPLMDRIVAFVAKVAR